MDDVAAGIALTIMERTLGLYARGWHLAYGAWWHVMVALPAWMIGQCLRGPEQPEAVVEEWRHHLDVLDPAA